MGKPSPFSRCAFASESCFTLKESPSCLPNKEVRRSADRRTTGLRPTAENKACQRMRRALCSPLPRIAAGLKVGGALAFRRPTAALRRGTDLDSAPGRASWNHRIQTGVPSPAPVQPAPGSPVTRRTVDAQSRPDAGYKPASGNRTRPIDRLSPVDVPSMGGSAVSNYKGDECQDHVSTSATKAFGLMSLHAPSPVAPCRRRGRRRRTGRRIHVAGPAIAAGYARLALLRRAVLAIPINVIAKSHDAPRRVPRRCPACRKIKAHRHRDCGHSDHQSQNGFHHENHSVFAPGEVPSGN